MEEESWLKFMKLILEKFVIHFNDLYGDREQDFYEEEGRRYFLLYLKPIINGTGNYYRSSSINGLLLFCISRFC